MLNLQLNDIAWLVLYALAAFRFTHLLWWENGPFDVFDWVRAKTGIRWEWSVDREFTPGPFDTEATYNRITPGNNVFAELLNCVHCLGGWTALIAAVAFVFSNPVFDFIAVWGTIWCVQLLLFGYKRSPME